ncbi:hypothetical protein Tco_1251464 [Tanacetum coccineum]
MKAAIAASQENLRRGDHSVYKYAIGFAISPKRIKGENSWDVIHFDVMTFAEKLSRSAAQLVAGRSAVKSVKVTLASARETNDLDTELLRTMVAKEQSVDQPGIIGTVRNILDEVLEIGKIPAVKELFLTL